MLGLRQGKIEYLERPATADEQAIAVLLDIASSAITERNIEKLTSVFSNSCIIEMGNGKKSLDVNGLAEYMKEKMEDIIRFSYSDVIIRVYNNNEATVFCKGIIILRNYSRKVVPRTFRCGRQDGEWRIMRANYM